MHTHNSYYRVRSSVVIHAIASFIMTKKEYRMYKRLGRSMTQIISLIIYVPLKTWRLTFCVSYMNERI